MLETWNRNFKFHIFLDCKAKTTQQISSLGFWENLWCANLLTVLSDLYFSQLKNEAKTTGSHCLRINQYGTVSPLSMGKCSWFFFLQKTLVFRSKTYNSQNKILALKNLEMSLHTSIFGGPDCMYVLYGRIVLICTMHKALHRVWKFHLVK